MPGKGGGGNLMVDQHLILGSGNTLADVAMEM